MTHPQRHPGVVKHTSLPKTVTTSLPLKEKERKGCLSLASPAGVFAPSREGEVCDSWALLLDRAATCCRLSCCSDSEQQAGTRAQTDVRLGWLVESFLGYLETLTAVLMTMISVLQPQGKSCVFSVSEEMV